MVRGCSRDELWQAGHLFGSRDPIGLLTALQARSRGDLAARLQVVVLLLLLAELHAAGDRNAARPPWMRLGPARAAGRRGRRPARGSQSGRRPRG